MEYDDWFVSGKKLTTSTFPRCYGWFILFELCMIFIALRVAPLFCRGRSGVAWNETKNFEGMYTAWQIEHTDCPTSADELIKIAGKKGQSGKDPWGNEYHLSCPSQHNLDIDICSDGPDGQANTEDDVCNFRPPRVL